MQGEELNGLEALRAPAPTPEPKSNDALGRDEFLRLLVVQLQNQDPLQPEDPAKFVSELTQFSNLEQLIAIRDGVQSFGASDPQRGVLEAAPLIGRDVLAAGNQLEVDRDGRGQLAYDLPRNATGGVLRVLDAGGRVVSRQALRPEELHAGRHRLELAFASESGIRDGVYRYELDVVADSEALTPIPYIAGVATGARAPSLGGEVQLLIGSIEVPLRDTFEVGGAR